MRFKALLIYSTTCDGHQVLGSKISDVFYMNVNQLLLFSFFFYSQIRSRRVSKICKPAI